MKTMNALAVRFGRASVLLVVSALLAGCCKPGEEITAEGLQKGRDVQRIEIFFDHFGWGAAEERIFIVFEGESFARTYTSSSHYMMTGEPSSKKEVGIVQIEAVSKLLHALAMPEIDRRKGLNLLSDIVMSSGIRRDPSLYTSYDKACHEKVAREYRRRLDGRKWIRPALEDYYSSFWTDDYPRLRVVVISREGGRVEMVTDSQQTMMLPFKVGEKVTWNYTLSDALADLLPNDSLASMRLSSKNIGQAAADRMLSSIWEDERKRPKLCEKAPGP